MIKELEINDINKYDLNIINKEIIENEYQNNPFAKFIIYIKNSKVLGYLYYSDIYDRAEINMFKVEKNERNKKIGNKILKYFIDDIKKEVTLEVKESNKVAIHLYSKYGFKRVAIREGYYNGEDGILMHLEVQKKEVD